MTELTIKELRAQTGMSQRAFAEHFGFSVRTLQGWERGKQPPEGTVQMITRILQLEAEQNKQKIDDVTNTSALCFDKECAPPFGDIDDCEFYLDGKCTGKAHLENKE